MNDAITTSYKSCNMYKTHGSYLKDMLTQQGHYFSYLYEKTNDYASMTSTSKAAACNLCLRLHLHHILPRIASVCSHLLLTLRLIDLC